MHEIELLELIEFTSQLTLDNNSVSDNIYAQLVICI